MAARNTPKKGSDYSKSTEELLREVDTEERRIENRKLRMFRRILRRK